MENLRSFLETELRLDPAVYIDTFLKFESLLLQWNQKINLVSRKSGSIEDLILNSIFFLKKFDFSVIKNFVDVGTGGGFPGIPLKILFPSAEVFLVDSIGKKILALDDIVKNLNLKDTTAVRGRAEDLSDDSQYKGKFDAVVSKSVASLDKLYEWGKNFLHENGQLLCIKGGNIESEITSLKKLKHNLNLEVIEFSFDPRYKIEDKKLVAVHK